MVSRDTRNPDEVLADQISKYRNDPLGYVMFMFPWRDDPTIQQVPLAAGVEDFLTDKDKARQHEYRNRFSDAKFGPDLWACDFLTEWGDRLTANNFDGHTACNPIQFATVSGHGIGKSVMVAWIIKFIMDTRPLSKGTITANTAEQLRTKTWAELGKWHRRSLTMHWYEYNTGRGAMSYRAKSDPEEWFATAQTCREENSEAFAGQHAANATSFYIFDEASRVPDKIYEVREGGTTDGEPMIFDFGNGTRNGGHFFEECVGKLKHRYSVRSIDSRQVHITNKKRAEEWIEDFGEESDFVKVRVRGMFPSAGSMEFISLEMVQAAQEREVKYDPHAPLIIGVDVARFGDDESVIYARVGWDARTYGPRRFRGLDGIQLATEIIRVAEEFAALGVHKPTIFIDVTGGVGASPYDQLVHLGYDPIPVDFGGACVDKKTYRYKSDELWGDMRAGLKHLCLPETTEAGGLDLQAQMSQREYGYTTKGNYLHLETKRDMKQRLGGSTGSLDIADALACTFFMPVAPNKAAHGKNRRGIQIVESDYDPLDPQF